MPVKKFRPFDNRLSHRAHGSAAMTATTTLATIAQKGTTRTEGITKVYVEAIDVADGDELYRVIVELSNDNFVTINAVAAERRLGHSSVIGAATSTAAASEWEIYWTTEVNNVTYRYWRVRMIASGTTPSITMAAYSTILE